MPMADRADEARATAVEIFHSPSPMSRIGVTGPSVTPVRFWGSSKAEGRKSEEESEGVLGLGSWVWRKT